MGTNLEKELEALIREKDKLKKRRPTLYQKIISGSPIYSAKADKKLTMLNVEVLNLTKSIKQKRTQIRLSKKQSKKPSQIWKFFESFDFSKK